ncbi:hypothetical protein N7490_002457 [Penicillium lividum]|nr:hypothetical protein N7490_002457 [Penicillium lividum]
MGVFAALMTLQSMQRGTRYPYNFDARGHPRQGRTPTNPPVVIWAHGLPWFAVYKGSYVFCGSYKAAMGYLVAGANHVAGNWCDVEMVLAPASAVQYLKANLITQKQLILEQTHSYDYDAANTGIISTGASKGAHSLAQEPKLPRVRRSAVSTAGTATGPSKKKKPRTPIPTPTTPMAPTPLGPSRHKKQKSRARNDLPNPSPEPTPPPTSPPAPSPKLGSHDRRSSSEDRMGTPKPAPPGGMNPCDTMRKFSSRGQKPTTSHDHRSTLRFLVIFQC